MKPSFVLALAALVSAILATACKGTGSDQAAVSAGATAVPASSQPVPPASEAQSPAGMADAGPMARGKVVEVLNTSGYTYVRVQPEGAPELWAATTEFPVAIGNEVVVSTSMPMANYESKTLGRTFDVVYFMDAIQVVGAGAGSGAGAGPGAAGGSLPSLLTPGMGAVEPDGRAHTASSVPAGVELTGIEKAPGGVTVADVLTNREALSGKDVAVRARVVKFNGGIMGKNWLHLRDGSGEGGEADVTVTTQDEAAVGELVIVRGKVVTNQDFGSGYSYDVMIQDAKLER